MYILTSYCHLFGLFDITISILLLLFTQLEHYITYILMSSCLRIPLLASAPLCWRASPSTGSGNTCLQEMSGQLRERLDTVTDILSFHCNHTNRRGH